MSGGYTDFDLSAPAPAGTVWKILKLVKCVVLFASAVSIILFVLCAITFIIRWFLFGPTHLPPSPSSEERRAARDSPEARQPRNPANQDQHHVLAQVTLPLMPGERFPTHIAQPAPLPRPREGITWPAHEV